MFPFGCKWTDCRSQRQLAFFILTGWRTKVALSATIAMWRHIYQWKLEKHYGVLAKTAAVILTAILEDCAWRRLAECSRVSPSSESDTFESIASSKHIHWIQFTFNWLQLLPYFILLCLLLGRVVSMATFFTSSGLFRNNKIDWCVCLSCFRDKTRRWTDKYKNSALLWTDALLPAGKGRPDEWCQYWPKRWQGRMKLQQWALSFSAGSQECCRFGWQPGCHFSSAATLRFCGQTTELWAEKMQSLRLGFSEIQLAGQFCIMTMMIMVMMIHDDDVIWNDLMINDDIWFCFLLFYLFKKINWYDLMWWRWFESEYDDDIQSTRLTDFSFMEVQSVSMFSLLTLRPSACVHVVKNIWLRFFFLFLWCKRLVSQSRVNLKAKRGRLWMRQKIGRNLCAGKPNFFSCSVLDPQSKKLIHIGPTKYRRAVAQSYLFKQQRSELLQRSFWKVRKLPVR